MNAKTLRRQLMAAIAMVLVATIALGSSTYAWFVQSSQVTADGMKVQAAAESGIEITYADSGTWGTVATSTASTGTLYPTSTNDVTAWYHAKANASTAKTALNDTYEVLDLGEDGKSGNNQYFLLTEYTIRSASATPATALTIDSVEATTTGQNTADLNKALRIAVVIAGDVDDDDEQIVHIYAPAGGDDEYTIWDGTATTGPSVAVTAADGTTAEDTEVSVDDSGVGVKIYAWYEGEDTELKSENLPGSGLTIDTMNLTVKFSATV